MVICEIKASDLEEELEGESVIEAAQVIAAGQGVTVHGVEAEKELVKHKRLKTLHYVGEGDCKTACGLTFLQDDFEILYERPAVLWPLCRRRECFGGQC